MIYLDSCLVIYLAEAHPTFGERLAQAILQAGQAQFAISPLVK